MRKLAFDLIVKTDGLAHKLHVHRWVQRPMCALLDLSCGITWSELRRERRELRQQQEDRDDRATA
jgi:hypothetical protein